jgi:hypothetical protein
MAQMNRDPSDRAAARPATVLDEDQIGPMGYQAWLHHAIWCPNRLSTIADPLRHFQGLDQRMEARLTQDLRGLTPGSNAHWQARRQAEPQVLAQMGMPPPEVDQPAWTPDDEIEPTDHPLADFDDAISLLDEAMTALQHDQDPTPAVNRLDDLHRRRQRRDDHHD